MATLRKAAITGVGGYVPDYVLTNEELTTIVDTNDEWIRTRTGIQERRIQKGEGLATSDLAVPAVEELLRTTGTAREEIDLVICATVTPDMNFPDTANVICDKVGITNAFTFDLSAACSGFLFALTTGARYVEAGSHRKVIVIGADKMSAITNYEDRTTCILFGDGAGCVLLEPTDEAAPGIEDTLHHSDGKGRHYLDMQGGGSLHPASHESVEARLHYLRQDGRPVFRMAVKGMGGVVKTVMERNDLTKDTLDWLVPHQANLRIIDAVSRQAEFPMDKVMQNIQRYGNTTAATLPLCLWDYEAQLRPDDRLILTAFGGGFTWGATYLRWAYDGAARAAKR